MKQLRSQTEKSTPPRSFTTRLELGGFTLIELLVVLVILTILSSLSLAGLNIGRQRAKLNATAATIRKINDLVMDQYESYGARVKAPGVAGLVSIRRIIAEEMPDSWSDVFTLASGACQTGPGRAYARYKQLSLKQPSKLTENGSAECLYMIVTRSGCEPDAIEMFRSNEVGDTDSDGLKEFLDGWGNPILFIRWAPGFSPYSVIQMPDPTRSHDPLDTAGVDPNGYALYPLIISKGADGLVGLTDIVSGGWLQYANNPGFSSIIDLVTQRISPPPGAVDESLVTAYRDNITNHDIMAR